jgi:hypothetical protein
MSGNVIASFLNRNGTTRLEAAPGLQEGRSAISSGAESHAQAGGARSPAMGNLARAA